MIISDTSPLSSLALVGYLSILKDIYTNVVIPQAVANELALQDIGGVRSRCCSVLSLRN